MSIDHSLLSVLLLLTSAFADLGYVPGTQRVAPVFESADLVCNCFVESLQTISEQNLERAGKPSVLRHVVAKVRVDDIYSHRFPVDTEVSVVFEEEIPTTASLPTLFKSETALMFLKISSPPLFEFADRFLGVKPFSSLPVQHGGIGIAKLESALTAVLRPGNRDDHINALRLLEGFDGLSPETLRDVSVLSDAADPNTALSSIAVLLKNKQTGSIQKLESYLRAHRTGPVPLAMLSAGEELGQGSNVNDLTELEALTSSQILSIKFGALAGIRKMRNPHSAKTLVELLDDSNADVRFLAVITLSEIFSKTGDYAPTMAEFGQNPDFYTIKWKTWWTEEGRDLSP